MWNWQTYSAQFSDRSSPIWRWFAGYLIACNLALITISLLATYSPSAWTHSHPNYAMMFSVTAIVFLQITPFARSIVLQEKSLNYHEIDEYERLIGYEVLAKAYRIAAAATCFMIGLLFLADAIAEFRLTAVSNGFWLAAFMSLFFSMPTILGAFAAKAPPKNDEGEDT